MLDYEIINFFNKQSWLANLLQIGGGVSAMLFSIFKIYRYLKNYQLTNRINKVSDWVQERIKEPESAKDLRIAILDDHPEDYPLESLRKLGYIINSLKNISLAEIPSLFNFQCLFLDINGVLDEDSKRGGLEILKRLKTAEGPYLVAVSSRGFDITMSEFFMLADQRLKKPIPPADFEGIIEMAFNSSFSLHRAAERIDQLIGFGNPELSSIKKKTLKRIRCYLETGKGMTELENIISQILPIGHSKNPLMKDLRLIHTKIGKIR